MLDSITFFAFWDFWCVTRYLWPLKLRIKCSFFFHYRLFCIAQESNTNVVRPFSTTSRVVVTI